MLFAFGPLLLSGKGWQLAAASSASSIPVWLCAIAIAGGGVMADRLGRANAVMVIGLLQMALGMLALPRSDMVVPALVLIGLSSGLPVGAIMGLPARVLTPSTRAAGTGLFFTVFYGSVVAAPSLAGALIDVMGWTGSAMDFGAAALLAEIALLAGFEAIAPKHPPAPGTGRMSPCADNAPPPLPTGAARDCHSPAVGDR